MLPADNKCKSLEVMDCGDPPCHEQNKRRLETSSQGGKENQCNEASSKSSHVKYQSLKHGEGNLNKCNDCDGKSFSTPASLQRHRLIHEGKFFTCDDCGKSFSRPDSLKLHSLKHKKDKPYKCDDCGKFFTLLCTLDQHRLNHSEENSKRNDCGESSTQSRLKQRKVNRHEDNSHKGDKCGNKFSQLKDLQEHKVLRSGDKLHKSNGSGNKSDIMQSLSDSDPDFIPQSEYLMESKRVRDNPHKCRDCGNSFRTVKGLKMHKLLTHFNSSFTCVDCGKVFTTVQNLKSHRRIHNTKMPNTSDNCVESFNSAQSLKPYVLVQNGEKPHKCGHCDRIFPSSQSLISHRCYYKKGKPCNQYECVKPLTLPHTFEMQKLFHSQHKVNKCEKCGKSFSLPSQLKNHKLSVHRNKMKFKCSKCSFVTFFKDKLIVHYQSHPDKTYGCDKCGKVYTRLTNLMRHKHIHLEQKPYKCDVCNVDFVYLSGLKKHSLVHIPDRPFRCDVCGKSFTYLKSLKRHMIYHRRVKPHTCYECNRSFYDPTKLKKHLLTVHRKKFKCCLCGFATFFQTKLKSHLEGHILGEPKESVNFNERFNKAAGSLEQQKKIDGGNKPNKCDDCGQSFTDLQDLEVHRIVLCNGNNVQNTDDVKSEIHESDAEFPSHSGPEDEKDEADYRINYSHIYSPQKIEVDDFTQENEMLQTTEDSPRVQVSCATQEAEEDPTLDNTYHSEVPNFDWELLHHPSPTNFPSASTEKVQQLAAALLAMVPCLTLRDQHEAEFALSMAVNYPVMADRERNILYQRLNLLYLAAYHGWPHAMAAISNSAVQED